MIINRQSILFLPFLAIPFFIIGGCNSFDSSTRTGSTIVDNANPDVSGIPGIKVDSADLSVLSATSIRDTNGPYLAGLHKNQYECVIGSGLNEQSTGYLEFNIQSPTIARDTTWQLDKAYLVIKAVDSSDRDPLARMRVFHCADKGHDTLYGATVADNILTQATDSTDSIPGTTFLHRKYHLDSLSTAQINAAIRKTRKDTFNVSFALAFPPGDTGFCRIVSTAGNTPYLWYTRKKCDTLKNCITDTASPLYYTYSDFSVVEKNPLSLIDSAISSWGSGRIAVLAVQLDTVWKMFDVPSSSRKYSNIINASLRLDSVPYNAQPNGLYSIKYYISSRLQTQTDDSLAPSKFSAASFDFNAAGQWAINVVIPMQSKLLSMISEGKPSLAYIYLISESPSYNFIKIHWPSTSARLRFDMLAANPR